MIFHNGQPLLFRYLKSVNLMWFVFRATWLFYGNYLFIRNFYLKSIDRLKFEQQMKNALSIHEDHTRPCLHVRNESFHLRSEERGYFTEIYVCQISARFKENPHSGGRNNEVRAAVKTSRPECLISGGAAIRPPSASSYIPSAPFNPLALLRNSPEASRVGLPSSIRVVSMYWPTAHLNNLFVSR